MLFKNQPRSKNLLLCLSSTCSRPLWETLGLRGPTWWSGCSSRQPPPRWTRLSARCGRPRSWGTDTGSSSCRRYPVRRYRFCVLKRKGFVNIVRLCNARKLEKRVKIPILTRMLIVSTIEINLKVKRQSLFPAIVRSKRKCYGACSYLTWNFRKCKRDFLYHLIWERFFMMITKISHHFWSLHAVLKMHAFP